MLIDWERAGPERRYELRVPNVRQAGKFYRDVFGAEETFRQETDNGKVFRLGFAIGRIGFAISSEGGVEQERPLLSSIAEEFGSPFVAIILRVEDPDRMAAANLQELMSWTMSRLLPIPSVVIGHWSSGNLSLSQTYPAWQSIENRTMIVGSVSL
jgi:uncharacterized glyoxalase superfamily protein PhnB